MTLIENSEKFKIVHVEGKTFHPILSKFMQPPYLLVVHPSSNDCLSSKYQEIGSFTETVNLLDFSSAIPLSLSDARYLCSHANISNFSTSFVIYAYNNMNQNERYFMGTIEGRELIYMKITSFEMAELNVMKEKGFYCEYDILKPSMLGLSKTTVKMEIDEKKKSKLLVNHA